MWKTTKVEATGKFVYGYQVFKCEETDDFTGKVRKFWMLYDPVFDQDEAGFTSYREMLDYAKMAKKWRD